jgi:hypothetical protein
MAIVMYALYENTCIYGIQEESFCEDLYKKLYCSLLFYKWHAYMYKGLINDS